MPFFGGGSIYRLVGTNIIGGNDVLPLSVGDYNIGLGNNVLQNLTTGFQNVAIGDYAFNLAESVAFTAFNNNTALGHNAGLGLIDGENNVAIGAQSLYSSGNNGLTLGGNIAIGRNSLLVAGTEVAAPAQASNNIAIGQNAGSDFLYGQANIFMGANLSAYHFRHGDKNIVLGQADFFNNVAGTAINNTIVIGYLGGGADLNLDNESIIIGSNLTQTGVTLLTEVINIGSNNDISDANSIIIGNNLATTVGNQIIIGDGTHTSIIIGGIDFSAGPTPAGSTLTRSKLFSAIFQAGTFTSVGMAAPTHFGGSIGFISGVGYYAAYGFNTSDSGAAAGSNAGFLGATSSGVYSNVEAEYNFLIAFNDNVATSRSFVGINNPNAMIANVNPSTLTNLVGVGHDSGDTNLSIIHNDAAGAATKTTLGANFPANGMPSNIYNVKIRMDGTGNFIVSVKNITLGIDSGETTISADMPSSATFLTWQVWRNNGAGGGVVSLGISQMSFEATI